MWTSKVRKHLLQRETDILLGSQSVQCTTGPYCLLLTPEGHRNLDLEDIACCPWSHGLRPKKLQDSVAVPPAPDQVPRQNSLSPSVTAVPSVANDKGDNEMCTDLWHLPYSWGKPRKTSAMRPSDERAVWPVTASNGVPILQWGR